MPSPDRRGAAQDPPEGPWAELAVGRATGPSLRRLALDSIEYGLTHGCPLPLVDVALPEAWRQTAACFVTLETEGRLRGCIGTFDASRSIAENVCVCAFRSAFEDPRFSPVTRGELSQIEVEISLLGPPRAFPVRSRADLLARLSPGVDGLTVRLRGRSATFLPAVWASLPEPADFVDALFQKAGLSPGLWSEDLRFERYTATKAH